MKYFIAFLASLLLLASLPAYAAKKAPAPAPQKQEQPLQQAECPQFEQLFAEINAKFPVDKIAVAHDSDKVKELTAFASRLVGKPLPEYTLAIALVHTDGDYGLLLGFLKDDGHATICFAKTRSSLPTPELRAELDKITGFTDLSKTL